MQIEPLWYCYRIHDTGSILYRDVRHGKWGIVEEPDSVFRLSEVRKWYDSRIKAMNAYERDRRKSCR